MTAKKKPTGTKVYMKNRGTGVPTKAAKRTYKRDVNARFIKGVSVRKMQNTECGKGSGFECTRPRGHTGKHYATHPSITADRAMRRRITAKK